LGSLLPTLKSIKLRDKNGKYDISTQKKNVHTGHNGAEVTGKLRAQAQYSAMT